MKNSTTPTLRRGVTAAAAITVATLALSGCAGAAGPDSEGLTEVVFAQPTPQSVIFWPTYVADELGYFAEEGIKLKMAPSAEISMAAFVTNGSALIAAAGASEALFAKREGAEIAVVMDWATGSAEGISVLEESDIADAADLEGSTVGVASDEDRAFLVAALGAVDLTEDDVEVIVVGAGGASVANALREGKIDAFSGPTSEVAALEGAGVDMREVTPDAVANTPAASMVVTKETLEERRDLVAGFLRAYAKATHAALANPEALKAMSMAVVPDEWRDEASGESLMELVVAKSTPDDPSKIGDVRPQVWEEAQQQMLDVGELEEAQDLDAILDDSLIADANDFDRGEVEDEMAEWLEENS
jgi:NitT/TauT family transport system substrate-binding protein